MSSSSAAQNGQSTSSISGNSQMLTSPGFWTAITIALGYVYVLRVWFSQMQATQLSGIDPFKVTSWYPAACLSILYLIFINAGPRMMKGYTAFDLKSFMLIYNVYQVALNVYCVVGLLVEVLGYGTAKDMTFWGSRYDNSSAGLQLGFYIWLHYNNKFVELLDTVWMVLRKKDSQVSLLHVYHHLLMMWAWLYVCKLECGGDAWFGAFCNSLVHVFMYTYYALSQMGVKCWWKIYLTKMQLLQFMVCMVHAAFVLYKGNMPRGLPLCQAFVMMNMLILFWQFYKKTYSNKRTAKKVE